MVSPNEPLCENCIHVALHDVIAFICKSFLRIFSKKLNLKSEIKGILSGQPNVKKGFGEEKKTSVKRVFLCE